MILEMILKPADKLLKITQKAVAKRRDERAKEVLKNKKLFFKNVKKELITCCNDRASLGFSEIQLKVYIGDITGRLCITIGECLDRLIYVTDEFKAKGYFVEITYEYYNFYIRISWNEKSRIEISKNTLYDSEHGIYKERLNQLLKVVLE